MKNTANSGSEHEHNHIKERAENCARYRQYVVVKKMPDSIAFFKFRRFNHTVYQHLRLICLTTMLIAFVFCVYMNKQFFVDVQESLEALIRKKKLVHRSHWQTDAGLAATNEGIKSQCLLTIGILSNFRDIFRRDAIRQTWGNDQAKKMNARFFFVIGNPIHDIPPHENLQLLREKTHHSDLLQTNVSDTYADSTALKGLVWVSWAALSTNCITVFTTFDDSFVSVSNLLNFIRIRRIGPNSTTVFGNFRCQHGDDQHHHDLQLKVFLNISECDHRFREKDYLGLGMSRDVALKIAKLSKVGHYGHTQQNIRELLKEVLHQRGRIINDHEVFGSGNNFLRQFFSIGKIQTRRMRALTLYY